MILLLKPYYSLSTPHHLSGVLSKHCNKCGIYLLLTRTLIWATPSFQMLVKQQVHAWISNNCSPPNPHRWKGAHSFPLHAGEGLLREMWKCITSILISISESRTSMWSNTGHVLLLWFGLGSIEYKAKYGHSFLGKGVISSSSNCWYH